MNRKRIIITSVLIIILLIIPIITLTSKRRFDIDEDGRTIIYSTDDLNDVESGSKISLAIPANTSPNEEENNKQIAKEKKQIAEKASKSRSVTELSQEEKEEVHEELKQFENKELISKTDKFVNIFIKYYGKEYSEELFETIKKETSEIAGEYKIPESSLVMLNKAIELYNNSELTENEKETLKYVFDMMDTSCIEDSNTLNNMKRAGIIEN